MRIYIHFDTFSTILFITHTSVCLFVDRVEVLITRIYGRTIQLEIISK